MKTTLEPPDKFHVVAAQGWLELGDHIAANDELEKVSAHLRAHPDVLDVRWQIYARAEKWEACADIAEAIIKLDPNRPDAWIHRSYALHELGRTQEAFDQLLPVTDKFPKVWTIAYNLSCYCAQLGRLDQCHMRDEQFLSSRRHSMLTVSTDAESLLDHLTATKHIHVPKPVCHATTNAA